jgi:hypothetical protein
MTDIIDPTKTFRLVEERIAKTTNPRHLTMLQRLLDHAVGEAKLDLDLVMSTLAANPRYVAWGAPADIYYGADAALRGFPVDDQDGFYLLTLRMLIVWPFDAEGFIIGEETYSAVTTPDFLKKVETSEVPQKFRDFIGAR